MSTISILPIAGLAAVSFSLAFLFLWYLNALASNPRQRAKGFMNEGPHGIAFLFEDDHLVDATTDAQSILTAAAPGATDLNRLLGAIAPTFPDLAEKLPQLAELGRFQVQSGDGSGRLEAEWRNGLARISIDGLAPEFELANQADFSQTAMDLELKTLRATVSAAPFLVWRQQDDGTVTWANTAYLDLVVAFDPNTEVASWPPTRLFDPDRAESKNPKAPMRLALRIPGEPHCRWFECVSAPVGRDTLYTAVAADRLVKAETSLRDFVQTLTKTFAHLTVGLAIFDKQRKLSLFNPALTDLTSMAPEFLIARPTLQKVLDRLRDKRMIPEPKDYKGWRQRLQDLEIAAEEGTYEETWSLPSGQTYRVVGRPHPDGAVAFLFEDISAEISLARRYRAEIETGQAVIDSMDEAIAVFSATGALTLTNAA